MKQYLANFRFYEELNDFVGRENYKQTIAYRFGGQPAIKDPIEVLGVPHSEIDLILVNNESVESTLRHVLDDFPDADAVNQKMHLDDHVHSRPMVLFRRKGS